MGAWIETRHCRMCHRSHYVAPLVGAWIETRTVVSCVIVCQSHPSWVRGLKLIVVDFDFLVDVAPLVGAWIETLLAQAAVVALVVAPLVGAWIETYNKVCYYIYLQSHPSWVRGLKLELLSTRATVASRTPRGCVD